MPPKERGGADGDAEAEGGRGPPSPTAVVGEHTYAGSDRRRWRRGLWGCSSAVEGGEGVPPPPLLATELERFRRCGESGVEAAIDCRRTSIADGGSLDGRRRRALPPPPPPAAGAEGCSRSRRTITFAEADPPPPAAFDVESSEEDVPPAVASNGAAKGLGAKANAADESLCRLALETFVDAKEGIALVDELGAFAVAANSRRLSL